jgi:hypothetical protein
MSLEGDAPIARAVIAFDDPSPPAGYARVSAQSHA